MASSELDQIRMQIMEILGPLLEEDEFQYVGDVFENPSQNEQGFWAEFRGHRAYLGKSLAAAIFTVNLCDWWHPTRDGELQDFDIEWFERRASLGRNWEKFAEHMLRMETIERRVQNINLGDKDFNGLEQPNKNKQYTESYDPSLEEVVEEETFEIETIDTKPGLWLMDNDEGSMIPVKIQLSKEGYRLILLSTKVNISTKLIRTKFAELEVSTEDELIELRLFHKSEDNPYLIVNQSKDGTHQIEKLELG